MVLATCIFHQHLVGGCPALHARTHTYTHTLRRRHVTSLQHLWNLLLRDLSLRVGLLRQKMQTHMLILQWLHSSPNNILLNVPYNCLETHTHTLLMYVASHANCMLTVTRQLHTHTHVPSPLANLMKMMKCYTLPI